MKLAISGNYATQFLHKPLINYLRGTFEDLEVYHAEFNAIDFEFIDSDSQLFQFKPDYIVWHESTLQLRDSFYQTSIQDRSSFAEIYQQRINQYINKIQELLPRTKIIFPDHNLLFNDNVYGNYSSKVKSSWDFQIQKLSYLLNEVAIEFPAFYLTKSRRKRDGSAQKIHDGYKDASLFL
jgi:hypothetical protein